MSRAGNAMEAWAGAVIGSFGQILARHHRLLMTKLDSMSRGDSDRLMIQMPPGSAKSTYASILLPAWWFTQHPQDSIIAACHTAGLATYFGRRARAVIVEEAVSLGYNITNNNRSNAHWSTTTGGEYYAVGTRGAIIGRRADLAIIDDPVKSQVEADNSAHRDRLWDWYRSDLVPRLKPNGRIVLVMTRWHQDDLCGRLLEHEPSQWHCLRLPAFADINDELKRIPGAPLWPQWEDTPALLRRRDSVGERAWLAQFQQSPAPNTGSLFKVDRIEVTDDHPANSSAITVRAWDLAATAVLNSSDPDWTVGLKLSRNENGRYIVLDVVRLRGSPREVEEAITTTARIDGRNVPIRLPEDPGQAGKSQVAYLTGRLPGYHVLSSRETGSKSTRAIPIASQIGAGNLVLLRANWNHTFLEELRDFPYGRKDDQVDALSSAFNSTLHVSPAARMKPLNHMSR